MGQSNDHNQQEPSGSQHTEVLPSAGAASQASSDEQASGGTSAAGGNPARDADATGADATTPTSRDTKKLALGIGIGVGVALLAYGGIALAAAGRMPPQATIGGVDVAGQSSDEALDTVTRSVEDQMSEPITLKAGDNTTTVDPSTAGLAIDPQESVDQVTSFTLNPATIAAKFFGNAEYDYVTSHDDAQLGEAIRAAANDLDQDPTEAAVEFEEAKPVLTQPEDGIAVNKDDAPSAVLEQWPSSWTVDLPFTAQEPEANKDDLDAVMTGFVQPALDGPITFAVGAEDPAGKSGLSATLSPEQFAPALSVVGKEGRLAGEVDGDMLRDTIVESNPQIGIKPKDARFEIVNGAPKVVPAVTGVSVDPEAARTGLMSAIESSERKATVKTATQEADLTTADAEKLGVVELISQFDSAMPHNPVRTHNIQTAANKINGTLLLPGEKFSMNEILGKRTKASGYKPAPVIMNGKLVDDYGGGISQLATTLFNGMFFAGLDELAHRPHSFYISRYPEGRESTINYGTIDLAFKNDSPHGVYIETWVSGGAVHTRFWGTKRYEVEAVKGPRRNIVPAPVETSEKPDCKPKSGAIGFKVSVTRILKQQGKEVSRETFNHTYNPREKVICKKPEPDPTPQTDDKPETENPTPVEEAPEMGAAEVPETQPAADPA